MSTVNPPSPSHRVVVAHFVAERAVPAAQMASVGFMTSWSLLLCTTTFTSIFFGLRGRVNPLLRFLDRPHVERNSCILVYSSMAILLAAPYVKGVAENTLEKARVQKT